MPKPVHTSSASPRRHAGKIHLITRPTSTAGDAVSICKDDMGSNQLRDPYEEINAYGIEGGSSFTVLRPPWKMDTLKQLPVRNAILLQCMHAMVTNCHGFGHSWAYIGEKGEEESAESLAEKTRIENLVDYPNETDSLPEIRSRSGHDYEGLGNIYLEVGRTITGEINFFYHIPSERCRICKYDTDPVMVTVKLPRNGKMIEMKARRYFRRFVQMIGTKMVYFKEFGDPRKIDPKTGKVNNNLAHDDTATEILHIPQYYAGSVYGVPCWVNNIPAIVGMREADMVNLQYFEDNAIPAMAITVAGGSLSNETIMELQQKFVQSRGRDQLNRVVVIEAVADMDAVGNTDSSPPVPTISIVPLRDTQNSDGLFLDYDEACMGKIRGAFRLPPIYVGRSDDYTRATAESSAQLAEIQVFAPRRNQWDDVMNLKLLPSPEGPLKYWHYRSNNSRLVDPALILQALTVMETLGAATPNLAITIANDLFGLAVKPIEDDWANKPFEFTKQEMAATAMKDAAALKAGANGGKPGEEDGSFPIKKDDMETLTRVTMALSQYIDEKGKLDEVVKAKAAAKLSEKNLKRVEAKKALLLNNKLNKAVPVKVIQQVKKVTAKPEVPTRAVR